MLFRTAAILYLCFLSSNYYSFAQKSYLLRSYLNSDSSTFAGARVIGQIWLRYNENNPGSLINGEVRDRFTDVSIRRLRLNFYAQIKGRTNIIVTIGRNNLNYENADQASIQLLDLYATHKVSEYLDVGAGQSAWNGLSRFTVPAFTNTLSIDVPVFALPTVNITDNILRKLSVFAKGRWKNWDYRLVFSRPFAAQNSSSFPTEITEFSDFANTAPRLQTSFYLKYQFFDHEGQSSPFNPLTYYGSKKVLSIGAGLETQPRLLSFLNSEMDTVFTRMDLFAVDLFGEIPFGGKKAITFSFGYFNFDFGPDYLRLIGINNVSSGTGENASFNGSGNNYPTIGTGETFLGQLGLSFLTDKENRTSVIQTFLSTQISDYERLNDLVNYYEAGVSYLPDQKSKLTLSWQTRPIFFERIDGINRTSRRSVFIFQYQFRIE